MNDNLVLRQRAVVVRLSKGGPHTMDILAKLSAYRVWANIHGLWVFNFQQSLIEVKTGQLNVSLSKGGHVQLVDLQNRTCTCQKPQLYGYYCSHMHARGMPKFEHRPSPVCIRVV